MAKDPAFLFYPGDWLGGTMTLTRHQKGCYMDLLMAQFNSGPLSLDQIKLVLGQDQATWTVLQNKFQKDNSGRFFNQKLATEVEKRKAFVESRSANKKGKKKSYHKSYENDMNVHMENRNENEDINEDDKGGVQGRIETYGPTDSENFFLISSGLLNAEKCRINGLDGLKAYYESHGSLIRESDIPKAREFMEARPGGVFNDFGHLVNAFNQFRKQPHINGKANGKSFTTADVFGK